MTTGKNFIMVLNERVETEPKEIDILDLKFWTHNPRINATIKRHHGEENIQNVTNEQIHEILWEHDSVRELKDLIVRDGGLLDEILVRDNVVLEGNSRLCAYRWLYNKAKKENKTDEVLKWSKIKAKVIPADTNDQLVFAILGTWHIKGKETGTLMKKPLILKGYTWIINMIIKK